ncbi:MAG: DNRLRE domain-containing protein [Chloroflexota bacterium]|nr:DNRLRE domain-containing protein [Chloroflexota bacterium]
MRHSRSVARLLIIAAILVLVSLTSTYARPTSDEPTPTTRDSEIQLLVAPFVDQHDAPSSDARANAGAASGTYVAVFAADIRQGSPSTNYATESTFYVGQDNGVMRGILKFDLSALPPNVTINNATLQVYLAESYDYAGASRTITAYRISSWWTEFLVAWNNTPTFAEAYDSVSISHGAWDWYPLDVTNLAQAWLDGTCPNYGIMLRGSENIAYRAFASDGTNYAPQLVIDYSLPEQALEVSPASSGFVIGNTAETSPTYTLRRDIQPLTIGSTTIDVLNWSATKVTGASWLSLDKDSGLFSVAEPDVIQVSVVTDTLASQGVYTEQIQISSSPVVQGSPQTIDVTFLYTDGLRLNFLPAVLKNRTFSPHDYHTVALFIGISDYIYMPPSSSALSEPRQPPKSSDLYYAGADANYVRDMSIDEDPECSCCGGGGALAFGKVASLTATYEGRFWRNNTLLLTEWKATRAAIREAFRWLDRWEREDTLVLITFSGHGGYMEDAPPLDEGDGYDEFIVAAESDGTSDMAGVISDDELAEWLDELESNNIVVIVDSCFSGGMINAQAHSPSRRVRTITPQSDVHLMAGDGLMQDISGPGRLIITASSETQASWEFGELESGALSYFLIQALLDPATDTSGDGGISFEEAFNYAASRVDDYVYGQTGEHQNPQLSDGIDGDVTWGCP